MASEASVAAGEPRGSPCCRRSHCRRRQPATIQSGSPQQEPTTGRSRVQRDRLGVRVVGVRVALCRRAYRCGASRTPPCGHERSPGGQRPGARGLSNMDVSSGLQPQPDVVCHDRPPSATCAAACSPVVRTCQRRRTPTRRRRARPRPRLRVTARRRARPRRRRAGRPAGSRSVSSTSAAAASMPAPSAMSPTATGCSPPRGMRPAKPRSNRGLRIPANVPAHVAERVAGEGLAPFNALPERADIVAPPPRHRPRSPLALHHPQAASQAQ